MKKLKMKCQNQVQQDKYFKTKKTFWYQFKLFFFPFYPIRVFKSTRLLSALAVLIALRLVLQYAVIHIPIVSTSFSLSWTPLMIIGWVYGPVIGFFSGIVTDTLSYLIKPTSLWFWMYAMQEPFVGLISGLIGSLYTLRILNLKTNFSFKLTNQKINGENKKVFIKSNNKFMFDLIINQIIVFVFMLISTLVVLIWASDNMSFEGKSKLDQIFFEYSKYIIIIVNIVFFIVVETITIVFYKKNKKNFLLFIWIVNLTIIITSIFSFLLGPISASEYYKYAYGKESPYLIKYGLIFYLIPRVIKESVKLPLQDLSLLLLIPITQYNVNKIKKNLRFSWKP